MPNFSNLAVQQRRVLRFKVRSYNRLIKKTNRIIGKLEIRYHEVENESQMRNHIILMLNITRHALNDMQNKRDALFSRLIALYD